MGLITAKEFNESKKIRESKLRNYKSFEDWCRENNREDILMRWDYDKNYLYPSEIGYGSTKAFYFKCPNLKHQSERKIINSITSNINRRNGSCVMECRQCNSVGQYIIDLFGEKELNKIWSKKNTYDPFNLSYGTKIPIWIKCQSCGNEKQINFLKYINRGLGCPKCSDGISYPNKFAFNILEQLGIDFISEYNPDWIKPKRYDFYFELNNNRYIIEMDGGLGHGNKVFNTSKTSVLETSEIDDYKDKQAEIHNIDIIRISCLKSEFKDIKASIQNSKLAELFDLSRINWIECNEFAYNSSIKKACDL